MIGASKILTVSYGTFSCTLEGFDEPFNTMKAIAEYFRDLAAEDRYFGAEPPTPDAAMLHKIAEREIHRRVEAKIQENGVILRAGDAIDAPAFTAQPSVTKPADLINYDDQPLLSDAPASGDSVAAKLSRLRANAAALAVPAVMTESYADDQPVGAVAAIADAAVIDTTGSVIEDRPAQIEPVDQFADLDADEPVPAVGIDVTPAQIDLATPTRDTLIADAAQFVDVVDQFDAVEELPAHVDHDALDDLARLDADHAKFDDQVLLDESLDQTWLADDKPTTDFTMPPSDNMDTQAADDAILAAVGAQIEIDDQSDLTILDDDFEDEFDGVKDSFGKDEVSVPAADNPAHDDVANVPDNTAAVFAPETPDAPAEPEIVQRARARVIKIRRADASADVFEPAAAPQSSVLTAEAEAALQAELAALEAEAYPAAASAPKQPTGANDTDFDVELDQISAEIATEITAPVRPQRPVRSINVARGTADVTATVAGSAEPHAANFSEETQFYQTVTEIPVPAEVVSEPRHTIETDLADEAVGRLMAQTNSALEGIDVKRRQSAIAHLKAAVAATEADRMIAPNQPVDDLTESYRSDLESVVRPMLPAAGDARLANADRPQPLVLVSAQRIDRLPRSEVVPRPEVVPRFVAPVRPRRIAVGAMAAAAHDSLLGSADDALDEDEGLDDAAINMFAEAESFADFADRLGASDLPDLLEAAAVYCAAVLGRPEFSRPLVLRQIATLPATADLSREDGLRMFGTLMRQGRIAKTRRGQFAVTDRSPLLAEAIRSAG